MSSFGLGAFGIDRSPSSGGGGPSIVFVPPTIPADTDDVMRIEVTGYVMLVITVSLPLAGAHEVAYLDGVFGPRYLSAENLIESISGGTAVELLRIGGWTERAITFNVLASGADGSTASASYTLVTSAQDATPSTSADAVAAGEVTRNLMVDAGTGDLVHDGRRLQLVSGIEAIAQDVRTYLSFFQGEWFLDEEFGIPYFQSILGRKTALIAVREIFRVAILSRPGVLSLISLELSESAAPREFVLSFRANTDLGELTQSIEVEV